jgi:hypothetical protein
MSARTSFSTGRNAGLTTGAAFEKERRTCMFGTPDQLRAMSAAHRRKRAIDPARDAATAVIDSPRLCNSFLKSPSEQAL